MLVRQNVDLLREEIHMNDDEEVLMAAEARRLMVRIWWMRLKP